MSKQVVPYLAPGCFGSALLFQPDMACAACPFRERCEPVHVASLAAMRARLGIVVKEEKVVTIDPDVLTAAAQNPERTTLPVKVQKLLTKIDRENFDIVGKMKRSENPFIGIKGMGYMAVTCHLIMKLEKPVTHKVVAYGLERKNKWTKGTADAHARMAIQALLHVGAIDSTDGILTARK